MNPSDAVRYSDNGWHPIPLPAHAKFPPPDNTTGYAGTDLTPEQVAAADWSGNIAVRMPDDVIGIDVDAYHGGKTTITDLESRHGALPATWMSHSNRGDGSGIRFFRVQPGHAWITGLPGVEIIQRSHRYAVVWPSIHPLGTPYEWRDERDAFAENLFGDDLPQLDDLPFLPVPWHDALSLPAGSRTHTRAADATEAKTFLNTHTGHDAPQCLPPIVLHFTERTAAGYARHDTMQHCLTWAMEEARSGLLDADEARTALHAAWTTALAPDQRRIDSWEFDAMLRHAIGKANDKTEDWLHAKHDEHAGIPIGTTEDASSDTQVSTNDTSEADKLIQGIHAIDWQEFAVRDSTDRQWLVDGFWPWGRGIAVWASAKAGKSELVLWCVGNLALGVHPWTGQQQEPLDVAYFDFEMTEDDLEERLTDFDFDPLQLDHLHYFLLPPMFPLDTNDGGEQVHLLAQAVGAQAVVIDTLMRSVKGEENLSDTFQDFARFTGSRLKRNGVGYLRTDHAGKDTARGTRGSSAKRDDVDVAWSLTRSKSGVRLDCTGSSRLGWVPQQLDLDRLVDPRSGVVSYRPPVALHQWPSGTQAKVAEIDALVPPLPPDAGRPAVIAALRNAGRTPGKTDVLRAAINYRKEQGSARGVSAKQVTPPILGSVQGQPDDLFDEQEE